jgi:hypothetical protein
VQRSAVGTAGVGREDVLNAAEGHIRDGLSPWRGGFVHSGLGGQWGPIVMVAGPDCGVAHRDFPDHASWLRR